VSQHRYLRTVIIAPVEQRIVYYPARRFFAARPLRAKTGDEAPQRRMTSRNVRQSMPIQAARGYRNG
jgi:hypothetical protein